MVVFATAGFLKYNIVLVLDTAFPKIPAQLQFVCYQAGFYSNLNHLFHAFRIVLF